LNLLKAWWTRAIGEDALPAEARRRRRRRRRGVAQEVFLR
jgi:hypothetical protein